MFTTMRMDPRRWPNWSRKISSIDSKKENPNHPRWLEHKSLLKFTRLDIFLPFPPNRNGHSGQQDCLLYQPTTLLECY